MLIYDALNYTAKLSHNKVNMWVIKTRKVCLLIEEIP